MTMQRIFPKQIVGVPAPGEVPWTASYPTDGLVSPVTGLAYTVDASAFPIVVRKGIGITAAVNMTDSGTGAAAAGIGFAAVANNNKAGLQKVWGLYSDAGRSVTGAGNASSAELQIHTLIPGPHAEGMTPYAVFLDGQTRGLGIGAGSDNAVMGRSYAIDMGLLFNTNGAAFWKGIVFRFDALMREGMANDRTKPGNSGYAHAINLAIEQGISMYSQNPLTPGGTDQKDVVRVYSSVIDATKRHILYWNDNAMIYGEQEGPGSPLAVWDYIPNAANYPAFKPGAPGQGIALEARGANANIGISITPKGAGGFFIPAGSIPSFADEAAMLAAATVLPNQFYFNTTIKAISQRRA